jgi:hypothetical protein
MMVIQGTVAVFMKHSDWVHLFRLLDYFEFFTLVTTIHELYCLSSAFIATQYLDMHPVISRRWANVFLYLLSVVLLDQS